MIATVILRKNSEEWVNIFYRRAVSVGVDPGGFGPLSPMIEVMNYDEKIAEYKQQMHDAEDALVEKGFSEEHWLLIRDYVLSAISLHSVIMAQSDSVHYSPRPVRMS